MNNPCTQARISHTRATALTPRRSATELHSVNIAEDRREPRQFSRSADRLVRKLEAVAQERADKAVRAPLVAALPRWAVSPIWNQQGFVDPPERLQALGSRQNAILRYSGLKIRATEREISGLTRRDFLRVAAAAGLAAATQPLGLLAAAEPKYQIGCYTRPWDQFDYRVALDGIAEAGFKYAGLMTAKGKTWVIINVDSTPEEVATIAREVKQRGLKTLSIYGGDFPVAKSIEAGIAGLKKLIDHCAVCACPNLLLGGTSDEKRVQPYYKVVAECCEYAAAKGVGLSVKPHGGQNATGPQCRKLIEQVGHKNFRLWYDPGNIFYYSDGKLDPVDDSATVDGLVVGMSVKDFKSPKEVLVTPGTGRVDFRKVFARLKQGGFTSGPLVVECLDRGDAAKVTAEAKKTRLFLEELTGQKG